MYIFVIILVLVLVAVFCAGFFREKFTSKLDVVTEKKETLSLSDVVSFFKQSTVIDELQRSEDNIAVAVKEKTESGSIFVVLCIYSKKSSTVKRPLKRFEVSALSEDLLSLFGDKEMIVLQ